jgi:hypothetical protein
MLNYLCDGGPLLWRVGLSGFPETSSPLCAPHAPTWSRRVDALHRRGLHAGLADGVGTEARVVSTGTDTQLHYERDYQRDRRLHRRSDGRGERVNAVCIPTSWISSAPSPRIRACCRYPCVPGITGSRDRLLAILLWLQFCCA